MRSLVSTITKPVSTYVLRPAIRLAKHPLAPLGMGVAGAVVEDMAKRTGLTDWVSDLGVSGIEFLKSSTKTGLEKVAGFVDLDDPPAKVESKKSETKKTDVAGASTPNAPPAGTPNAYEAATGIHVGCAKDKACGPCAEKQLLAKVGEALKTMTPEERKAFEVGLARKPLVPRTHAAVASQANTAANSYQAQINQLQMQLQQAQGAVQQQALTDQIAALQAQLTQANAVAQGAQAGGALDALLAQLTKLKSIEALLTPAAPAPAYGSPPWGVEESTYIQDPNGLVFEDPSYGEFDGEELIDPANPMASFDPYGYDPMVTRGVEEDYDGVLDQAADASVAGSVNEYMQPQPDEEPVNLDLGPREQEVVLDDEIDCESCQRIY